ncbi:hypothetical protein HPP92_009105 [Vanilla planifolia]|uniref:Uncharacterized protein n=1 Tax=Vanilla planifolia TaxID=51239 RepID=A0A835R9D1_VANPL|nr:hypothetical protein HPP92_009105 [Vanilla planifolia]
MARGFRRGKLQLVKDDQIMSNFYNNIVIDFVSGGVAIGLSPIRRHHSRRGTVAAEEEDGSRILQARWTTKSMEG